VEKVCPFLAPELNEDELGRRRFADHGPHDQRIGFHHKIFAGYVREGEYRASGTSGGTGTWIGVEMMRRGLVDGVIHVKPIDDPAEHGPFFEYRISRDVEQVIQGRQTRYHVIEISKVMAEVRRTPGRYLFIGLPCICKAVRRLQAIDPVIEERIQYVVSLVCGHLKSANWTLSLGWAVDVPPQQIAAFQYRIKGEGIPARAYVFRATPRDKQRQPVARNAATVTGGRFNAGAMMLNACDYCDDVVGETADLTIGDAWLPRYDSDSGGTNLLITREPTITNVLTEAAAEGRLFLESLTADQAAGSQSGGLRHRREGLSYRLAKAADAGRWAPVKRVEPEKTHITRLRKRIYDLRARLASVSREAFLEALQTGDYQRYVDQVQPIEKRLRRLEVRSVFFRAAWKRVVRSVNRLGRSVVRRIRRSGTEQTGDR
jgi:coenzyme F420-reducing hydrogenase beta subunit